jgi:hypothetical protein
MSYSKSDRAFTKVQQILDTLINIKGDSATWITNDPNSLAYQIRQGLKIAADEPEKYGDYSKLKNIYKITVKSNLVSAVRFVPVAELKNTELNSMNGFKKTVIQFEIPEVKEPLEVIGALIETPQFEEYIFKDYTEITEKELNIIHKYTSKNNLFIINSNSLIITRKEPPEELSWKPTNV